MSDRLPWSATDTTPVVWLLELHFAGRVVRVATADVDVAHASAGTTYHYVAAIDVPGLAQSLEVLAQDGDGASVSIEAVLPVDVPALVAEGHEIDGCTAELSMWIDGDDYADRSVQLVGTVSQPEYGAAEEETRFTVESAVYTDTALTPGPTLRVDGTTWAHVETLEAQHLGAVYPIVIGRPGVVSTAVHSRGWIAGSPARWVWFDRAFVSGSHCYGLVLVVAGHHVDTDRVMLVVEGYTTGARFVVTNGFDLRGQPIAYANWYAAYSGSVPDDPIEYDATGTTYSYSVTDADAVDAYGLGHASVNTVFATEDQPAVSASWYRATDTATGGLLYQGRLLRGAGDVITWAAEQSSFGVDLGRCAAARAMLAAYQIDTVIAERVTPWEWIRDYLLPILPVSVVSGPSGLYYVVWRWDAVASDAVVHLDADADPEIERTSPIRIDSSKRRSAFTLNYCWNWRTGTYEARARLVAVATSDDDRAWVVEHTAVSAASEDSPDRSSAELELSTPCVYADTTADAVLYQLALAYGRPWRTVQVRAPAGRYGRLIERGSVVTITQAEVHLSSAVALVRDIEVDGADTVRLDLLLRHDGGRDLWAPS